MEDITEFKKWLYQLLQDSEKKLGMKDATLAFILMNVGLDYFMKCYGHKETKG